MSLRILFVSNLFPPHHIGGYELVCQRVAEGLRERGHQIRVLTSSYGTGPMEEGGVHRLLNCAYRPPDYFPDAEGAVAMENSACLSREIKEFRPDVAVLWNVHGLGMAGTYAAAMRDAPHTATRLGDYQLWPNWDPKRPVPPDLARLITDQRLICAANCRTLGAALSRVGVPPERIAILRSSIPDILLEIPEAPSDPPPLRILWAGRIGEQKGLRVATEAAIILAREHRIAVELDIVGQGDEGILSSCLSMARSAAETPPGANIKVEYLGPATRVELARHFPRHHVYVAPSTGHEAFPMTCIEAMAAGTPVVASRLGGLVEMTQQGHIGLLFEPGNAAALAGELRRLATDSRLRRRLSTEGRKCAVNNFSRSGSLDRFEAFVEGCARGLSVDAMPPAVPRLSDPEPGNPKGRSGAFQLIHRVLGRA